MAEREHATGEDCQTLVLAGQRPNKLRQGFISLAETLLESVSDVFPECQNTEAVLRIFRTLVKGNDVFEDQFIRRCQTLFKQHAAGVKDKNAETLFKIVENLEHLRDIELREKWEDPDFTQESRNHLWQYVAALKTYADLYTAVPKEVMGKIESVAGRIGEQLSKGELDLKNMDLGAIGQNLMSNLTPEELAGFEGNLPDIYASLSDVAGALGGAAGANIDLAAMMEQLSKQTGEGGGSGLDMAQVLQQMSSQMPPATGGGNGAPAVDISQLMQAMAPMLQNIQQSGQTQPTAREKPNHSNGAPRSRRKMKVKS